MTNFRYEPEFSISWIDHSDTRFRSRLDMEKMAKNIDALKADIEQRGQIDPVGIARLVGEGAYIVIYGFTRTRAIMQLGRQHIRANVYEGLKEQEARVLNAANNSMREDLDPWERALQIKNLRRAGIPVQTEDPNKDSICVLMKMSRRNVFNWLRVVEYGCSELHDAIADNKTTLKHALEFVNYEPDVTASLLQRCIDEEWTSSELRLRLQSATLHCEDELAGKDDSEGAALHCENELAGKDDSEGAALHSTEEDGSSGAVQQLRKAATRLMQVHEEDVASMDMESKTKLRDGLRMVLEVTSKVSREAQSVRIDSYENC